MIRDIYVYTERDTEKGWIHGDYRVKDGHKPKHREKQCSLWLRDDSQRKHTNLFFMLAVFGQCSHPDFHPSVSVSLCEDLWLHSVSPVLFLFFFYLLFFPKGWFDLTLSVLHRDLASDVRTQIWSHAESLSDQRTVETPYSVYIFCDAYLCSCTQTAMFTCIPGSRCSPLNPVRHTAGLHWKGCFLFLFPTCGLPVSWHHLFLK